MTMISMDDMVKSRDGNHVKVESEIHLSRPSFISRYIDGQGSLDSSLAGKKPPPPRNRRYRWRNRSRNDLQKLDRTR